MKMLRVLQNSVVGIGTTTALIIASPFFGAVGAITVPGAVLATFIGVAAATHDEVNAKD